jgi:hypothetical protein
LLVVLTDIACQHIGPKSIVDDRLAYNKKILTSWEQQTLLNIVRVRYDDLVSFVDVSTVSQSHSLMGSISGSLGASIPVSDVGSSSLSVGLGASGSRTDTPTITYTPLTGAEFTRNINAPLKVSDIFNLIESSYSADVFLNLTLYSINGVTSAYPENKLSIAGVVSSDFARLTRAIRCAHEHGGDLNFYVQSGTDSNAGKVFMFIADKDCEDCPQGDKCERNPVAFIRQTLHLRAGTNQFEIVQGSRPLKEDQIVVRTRSAIAAIRWLATYINLPLPEIKNFHLNDNVVSSLPPPFKVDMTTDKPRNVFAAVQYKGYWFSIQDNDKNSKFALIYLRTLLAYADTGPKPPGPVLTIPTR